MDIKPENLISLLQQHKPLPQAQVLLLWLMVFLT